MMVGRRFNFLGEKHQGEGLLPWVIAVMLFLCSISLIMGTGIGKGLSHWSEDLAAKMTIQIVSADKSIRDKQTNAALTLLQATPGIKTAEVMADAEMMALLKPWLGDIPAEAGLPVPTLIDVTLTEPGAVNVEALTARLKAAAYAARIDDHQEWISRILDLAGMVQLLLGGIGLLVILSTIAIVIFGCRAGLASQQKNIEIMHLLGAEDSLISGTFERRYLKHGIAGGLGGIGIAAATLYGLATLAERMGQGLLNALVPASNDYILLIALPILTGIITMITAGLTVRNELKELI